MFHPNDWDVKTREELESVFKGYCEWCWEHGFGSCEVCKARMREYLGTLPERGAQDAVIQAVDDACRNEGRK